MRRLSILLLLWPVLACAGQCKYQAPRHLQADLSGIRVVEVDVHSHAVHVTGTATAHALSASGRACTSDRHALSTLTVTAQRQGDRLLVDVGAHSHYESSLFGSSYGYLEIDMQLPGGMPLLLDVGSGDAAASNLHQLGVQVGSGDLHVQQVGGDVTLAVSSGDVEAESIGSLHLTSLGAGDVKVHGIRGDAVVGSIGSGDVLLRTVGGNVHVGSLGSGDLSVKDVRGTFSLDTRGSGDVNHVRVHGKVSVPRVD